MSNSSNSSLNGPGAHPPTGPLAEAMLPPLTTMVMDSGSLRRTAPGLPGASLTTPLYLPSPAAHGGGSGSSPSSPRGPSLLGASPLPLWGTLGPEPPAAPPSLLVPPAPAVCSRQASATASGQLVLLVCNPVFGSPGLWPRSGAPGVRARAGSLVPSSGDVTLAPPGGDSPQRPGLGEAEEEERESEEGARGALGWASGGEGALEAGDGEGACAGPGSWGASGAGLGVSGGGGGGGGGGSSVARRSAPVAIRCGARAPPGVAAAVAVRHAGEEAEEEEGWSGASGGLSAAGEGAARAQGVGGGRPSLRVHHAPQLSRVSSASLASQEQVDGGGGEEAQQWLQQQQRQQRRGGSGLMAPWRGDGGGGGGDMSEGAGDEEEEEEVDADEVTLEDVARSSCSTTPHVLHLLQGPSLPPWQQQGALPAPPPPPPPRAPLGSSAPAGATLAHSSGGGGGGGGGDATLGAAPGGHQRQPHRQLDLTRAHVGGARGVGHYGSGPRLPVGPLRHHPSAPHGHSLAALPAHRARGEAAAGPAQLPPRPHAHAAAPTDPSGSAPPAGGGSRQQQQRARLDPPATSPAHQSRHSSATGSKRAVDPHLALRVPSLTGSPGPRPQSPFAAASRSAFGSSSRDGPCYPLPPPTASNPPRSTGSSGPHGDAAAPSSPEGQGPLVLRLQLPRAVGGGAAVDQRQFLRGVGPAALEAAGRALLARGASVGAAAAAAGAAVVDAPSRAASAALSSAPLLCGVDASATAQAAPLGSGSWRGRFTRTSSGVACWVQGAGGAPPGGGWRAVTVTSNGSADLEAGA